MNKHVSRIGGERPDIRETFAEKPETLSWADTYGIAATLAVVACEWAVDEQRIVVGGTVGVLPDGKVTADVEKHRAAWRPYSERLAGKVEVNAGLEVGELIPYLKHANAYAIALATPSAEKPWFYVCVQCTNIAELFGRPVVMSGHGPKVGDINDPRWPAWT